jgi:tetratricopeptide (TPR) repeat protein
VSTEPREPDLRREITTGLSEAHAVATRTHNAVATLAASLKEVVTRQQKYERGLNLNSFVAYLLFTVLLGGGFFLLYRSRAGQLAADRDEAVRKQNEAREQADVARKELAAREEGARQASEFWALVSDRGDSKKAEAIARWSEVQKERLTPVEAAVFQQAVARARAEIVDAGFAAGVEAVKGEQWKRAATELKRALTYEEEGPRAAQMRYYYGIALTKQGDYQEAVRQLDAALSSGAERTVGADARFYLASALELGRQLDRARGEYLKFADAHSNHPWANLARKKAWEIAQRSKSPTPN